MNDDRMTFYGFLTGLEDDGDRQLTVECTSKRWVDKVWDELKASDQARIVLDFLGRDDFETAFERSTQEQRRQLTQVYLWFLDRLTDTQRGKPTLGVFMGPMNENMDHHEDLNLSNWYELVLMVQEGAAGSFMEILDREPYQKQVPCLLHAFERVGEEERTARGLISQGALRALHFPNIEEEGEAGPG